MIKNYKYFIHIFFVCFSFNFVNQFASASTFSDNFEDGILNSSVYQPLGGAVLTEENGKLQVSMNNTGDGVEMLFGDLVSNSEWFMMDFDGLEFSDGQNFTFSFFDESSLAFNVSTFIEAVPTSNNITTNNGFPVKECKAKIVFQGKTVGLFNSGEAKFKDGKWECNSFKGSFRVDWNKDKWQWTYDWLSASGGALEDVRDEIIPNLPLPNDRGNIKKVLVEIGSPIPRDPILLIDNVGVRPVHTTPEPSTIFGSLLTLSSCLFLKRKSIKQK